MNLSVKEALAAIAGPSKARSAYMAKYGIAEIHNGKRGRRGQPVSDSTANKSAIAAFVLDAFNGTGRADTVFTPKVQRTAWQ